MQKTILELDLIGYSDKARELEEQLNVSLVMQFNDQIQEFVDTGLEAAGLTREYVIVQSTGDGAIVVLDEAEQAHNFAEAVNDACKQHNSDKSVESAKRWFRIAAATGDVEIRGDNLAGIVIANAVRLETAGESGHFLVDRATYDNLPQETPQALSARRRGARQTGRTDPGSPPRLPGRRQSAARSRNANDELVAERLQRPRRQSSHP